MDNFQSHNKYLSFVCFPMLDPVIECKHNQSSHKKHGQCLNSISQYPWEITKGT
jgi:hypothetical protein